MSLFYTDMFGEHSKIDTAIARLKNFESYALELDPEDGYYVADSGGKDSSVIKQLCLDAGVKFAIHNNHTTVDHPETVYFIRREMKRFEDMGIKYTVEYSRYKDGTRKTMWNLIERNGIPTMTRRFCCENLKEGGGLHKVVVTGVRWAESVKRRNRGVYEAITANRDDGKKMMQDNEESRKMVEQCIKKTKTVVNPIIDWSDEEVWEYIRLKNVPYNPLYDMGYTRVGCVGCAMNVHRGEELQKMPCYKRAYLRAWKKYLDAHPHLNGKWGMKTMDDWYDWWISGKRKNMEELTMFDEESEEENDND